MKPPAPPRAAARGTEAPEALGLREQNKLDKQQRIREAARTLFEELGYDAATLRAIAERAGVALGTLFQYAADKRDLVFLMFNEELEALTAEATHAPRTGDPLLEQLMALFAPYFHCFAPQPGLARVLLRELTFYSEGREAAAFLAVRQQLVERIVALVAGAQADGRLARGTPPEQVARAVFFIYAGTLRWWIAHERPQAAAGIAELRALLALALQPPAR